MNNSPGFSPPYGPSANTATVISKWRDHSIPEQITKEWMTKIGLSPNLFTLNLRALQFLGLVDESGYPTDAARRLRTAPSDEYHKVLEQIVRSAYKPIFEVVEPTTASRTQVDDAFRHEKPEAQRARMVAFFLGMCREAGITLQEAPVGGRPSKAQGKRVGRKTAPKEQAPVTDSSIITTPLALPPAPTRSLDPALVGIVGKIGELETKADLDAWVEMFRAAFNFVKKIQP